MAENKKAAGRKSQPFKEWICPITGIVHPCAGTLVDTGGALYVQEFNLDPRRVLGREKAFDPEANEDSDLEETFSVRGRILDFSRRSQRRLSLALSSWIPFGEIAVVTLTYASFWPDADGLRRHKQKFLRALNMRYPKIAGMWRLEYQVRGAPHWHLVVCGAKDKREIDEIDTYVRQIWSEIASHDGSMLRTEVEPARNPEAAKYYLTKELGKSMQSRGAWQSAFDKFGHEGLRFWGWFNKKELSFDYDEYELPHYLALRVGDAIKKRVIEKMEIDGRVKLIDGEYFKGGELVEMWRVQSWMLFPKSNDTLKAIWGALDWADICEHMHWDDPPPIEVFLTSEV